MTYAPFSLRILIISLDPELIAKVYRESRVKKKKREREM
jgi:hypothetical protein